MNFKNYVIIKNLRGFQNLGGLVSVLFLMLAFFMNTAVLAQEMKIQVSNAEMNAELFQLEGEKTDKIDSVLSENGIYQFTLKDKPTGFYRLQFDSKHRSLQGKAQTGWIDFINDGNDVELKTDYNNIIDELTIIKSESNRLYYEYIKLNKDYKTKTELLQLILARYPQGDDYYKTTQKKLTEIQDEYLEFVNSSSQKDQNSFIARYIKSSQLPVIEGSIPAEDKLDYLKKHSLDNVDFNDDEMIYSNLFTNKSIEYLTYFRNPQLPKPLLEKEFMKAVDTLLIKAKVNDVVYQHITEYLIDGFTKFGFDNIIDYIITNYVMADDLCLNDETGSSIQRRVNQAKLLKVGEIVPNIILPDTAGKGIDLSELTSEKILILFYASWCPHCKTIIPKIREIYNSKDRSKLEVIAISLDTNEFEWVNFIKDNNLNWLNVSDLKGWDSGSAESYFIYATPTMFLVDKDKKIIAKPLTIEELKLAISK